MPFFEFPDPVNETSARVVAGGVVTMAGAAVGLDKPWLLAPITYGFAARVATGPKLSPLGRLATQVVTPQLEARGVESRHVPGAPKRLAQGMGLTMSGTASLLYFGLRRKRAAYGVLSVLIFAAFLESAFGICLACKMYPLLVKAGLASADSCPECVEECEIPEAA